MLQVCTDFYIFVNLDVIFLIIYFLTFLLQESCWRKNAGKALRAGDWRSGPSWYRQLLQVNYSSLRVLVYESPAMRKASGFSFCFFLSRNFSLREFTPRIRKPTSISI
jgi:hypothetical protein